MFRKPFFGGTKGNNYLHICDFKDFTGPELYIFSDFTRMVMCISLGLQRPCSLEIVFGWRQVYHLSH